MAIKIVETGNGQVIEKTAKQVKTERVIRRVQKYITISAMAAILFTISAVCAFAAPENSAPSEVAAHTTTMDGMMDIIFWLLRVIVLAAGAPQGIKKIVEGKSNEDERMFNSGVTTLIVTAAGFAATFGVEAFI